MSKKKNKTIEMNESPDKSEVKTAEIAETSDDKDAESLKVETAETFESPEIETEEIVETPEIEKEETIKPDPPEVETEEIVKPDPTEVETRGQKKWSFPTVSRCQRCGSTDTICRNTNIITGTQYRQCQRAICRYNYSVKGTKV